MGQAAGQPTQEFPTGGDVYTNSAFPIKNEFTTGGPRPTDFVPPTPTPMVQPTGPSVFQQSAGYLGQAGQTYGNLANFQAPTAQAAQISPASTMQGVGQAGQPIQAGQIAQTNIGQYMSPYTQQVIERGEADIARQREKALNQLGASATAAGAFGGSRQGLAEGETYGQYGRMAADFAAQQRQNAFQQAQQAAQFDIGTGMQAQQLNQRAAEAAAAREQAARSGNMAAANQFAMQQAQLEQQANLSNQQASLAGAGVQQAGAAGLGGLAGQAFGMGQSAQQAVQQQAMQQRMLEQQILDAQRAQYQSQVGAPLAGLGLTSSILAGLPANQGTSYRPGLLDYVMAGSKLLPF
jgi:hypothetical protein